MLELSGIIFCMLLRLNFWRWNRNFYIFGLHVPFLSPFLIASSSCGSSFLRQFHRFLFRRLFKNHLYYFSYPYPHLLWNNKIDDAL